MGELDHSESATVSMTATASAVMPTATRRQAPDVWLLAVVRLLNAVQFLRNRATPGLGVGKRMFVRFLVAVWLLMTMWFLAAARFLLAV